MKSGSLKNKIKSAPVKTALYICCGIFIIFSLVRYILGVTSLSEITFPPTAIAENAASGLYEATDSVLVPKGDYEYTVVYDCSGAAGDFIWPFGNNTAYNSFEQSLIYLSDGTDISASKTLRVNYNQNMCLRLNYTGSAVIEIKSVVMHEKASWYNRTLILSLLFACLAIACITLYSRSHAGSNIIGTAIVLAAIGVLSSFPSFFNGVGTSQNDLTFHLTRIQGIAEGLMSGQFPVRINPTFYNGYGYADTEYYGNLLLYIPAFLYLAGFKLSVSYNIFVFLVNIATAWCAYYAFKKISLSQLIALFGSLIYTVSPYRITCLYYRGAVGEYTAQIFLPIIIYGLWLIYTSETNSPNYKKSFIPLVIGLSGIVQTHILTCEMVAIFILILCIVMIKRTVQIKRLLQLVISVFVTLLLNLWFILPFADCLLHQYVKFNAPTETTFIQKTGLYFSQLFTMFPEYSVASSGAGNGTTYKNEMPLILGVVYLIGVVLLIYFYGSMSNHKKERREALMTAILGILAAFMTTIYFPWDRIISRLGSHSNLISTLQFTWRFLGISTALLTVTLVITLTVLMKEGRSYKTVCAVLAAIALITPLYMTCQVIQNQSDTVLNDISEIGYNTACTVGQGEYSLVGDSWDVVNSIFEPQTFNGVQISDYKKNGTTIDFTVDYSGEDGYIYLPLLAYNGYSAKGDTAEISNKIVGVGDNMVLKISIPDGYTGRIHVYFRGFRIWRAAEVVSLLTLICLILFSSTKFTDRFIKKFVRRGRK